MPETINRTLSRGLRMLEVLSRHPKGLALHELSRELDLPKSTAYNLIRTLVGLKYAIFNPIDNVYTLGLSMFEVGSAAINNYEMIDFIRTEMANIFSRTNETIHLGMRVEGDIIYINKIDTTQPVKMNSYIGARVPLYATAMGKAVLSDLPDRDVRRICRGSFTRFTENTVPDVERLIAQLALCRSAGYAIEQDEHCQGISCVAIHLPPFGQGSDFAVSISLPSYRTSGEVLEKYGQILLASKDTLRRMAAVYRSELPEAGESTGVKG